MFRKATIALALLGAATLPVLAGTEAPEQANAATVVRDPVSKKLRAATPAEMQELHNGNANGQSMTPRSAPVPPLQKYHASGARGVRLNDEMMSSSVAVRTANGKLEMQCHEPGHHGHEPHAAHATLQPVTE